MLLAEVVARKKETWVMVRDLDADLMIGAIDHQVATQGLTH